MAKGNSLKSFISQRVERLRREIHVRRLLLSNSLVGVFTGEERTCVENEYSETKKCELFLQTVLRKDDTAVEKFVQALREKQPTLSFLKEWEDSCNQESVNADGCLTSVKEAIESEDFSEVPQVDLYKEALPSADCYHGNTPSNNLGIKPSPLTADFTHRNIDPSSGVRGSDCEMEYCSVATKVINCLSQHITMNLMDREDINRALAENDAIRDVNQRLVDIIVRLVRQKRVSPYVIEGALNTMGLNDLAEKLLQETVHDKYIHDLPVEPWTKLTQELSLKTYNQNGDTWMRLPSLLGIEDSVNINYIKGYSQNPAEAILNIWRQKRDATIRNLYNILRSIEAHTAAIILEPYLPVVMATEEYKDYTRSTSTYSSISDNELVASKSLNS